MIVPLTITIPESRVSIPLIVFWKFEPPMNLLITSMTPPGLYISKFEKIVPF
jgi:hypothetical protein